MATAGLFSFAPVIGLLFPCSPPAIAFFVIAIVVDSVNREVVRWPASNITKKVIERGIQDLYSTPTIERVFMIFLVVAALKHRVKDVVFWSAAHAVYLSFFYIRICDETTTRFYLSTPNVDCSGNMLRPANANAKPYNVVVAATTNRSYSGQPAKCLTSELRCNGMELYNFISHFVTSNNNLVRVGMLLTSRTRTISQENNRG